MGSSGDGMDALQVASRHKRQSGSTQTRVTYPPYADPPASHLGMCRICERSLDDFEPLFDCLDGNCCMECTDVFFASDMTPAYEACKTCKPGVQNHSTGRPRQAGRGLGTAVRAFDGKNVIVSRYGNFSCAHINSKASSLNNTSPPLHRQNHVRLRYARCARSTPPFLSRAARRSPSQRSTQRTIPPTRLAT